MDKNFDLFQILGRLEVGTPINTCVRNVYLSFPFRNTGHGSVFDILQRHFHMLANKAHIKAVAQASSFALRNLLPLERILV